MSEMKEAVVSKLTTIRVQDVTLIILCALSIYLFRVQQHHTLLPQWRHDFNMSYYANTRFPGEDERLPRPIITDLEGDGVSEVVMVTNEMRLEVLIFPPGGAHSILPDLEVKYSQLLPLEDEDAVKRSHPVVIETGFLSKYTTSAEPREQVIVILLDNWNVLCYNSQLQLLWTQKLMEVGEARDSYYVKSAGILVSSTQLTRKDQGTIIVGASFAHKGHEPHLWKYEVPIKTKFVHPARMHATTTPPPTDVNAETFVHFSTFAISGTDGSVRWHHLPGDFEADQSKQHDPHHWKLGLKKGVHHLGEEHWTRFSQDLLKQLPFSWTNIHDTHLELGLMRKNELLKALHEQASSAESSTSATDLLGALSSEHLIGSAYGGMKPHSRHEHVETPNSVLVFSHYGIEILSLATGRPYSKLKLMEEQVAFADVNGDGGLDRVRAHFADAKCQLEATSLQPAAQVLFTGPICNSPSWLGSLSLSSPFFPEPTVTEYTHLSLTPVLVKSVALRSSPMQHLMGHSLPSQRAGYDTIVMTSTGRLSSYGPHGEFNWQVRAPARWSEITHAITSGNFRGSAVEEVYRGSFKPSMTAFARQVYGKKTLMVILGWDTISVVGLEDGRLLTEHSLPCQPIASPKIADYNNDGVNDVILSCPSGYVGLLLESQPNYLYMGLISLTVILAILLLTWCFRPESSEDQYWDD